MLDGNMQDNFLHAIEGRLVSFLYRCHFFRNFFEILDVIKQDIVIIRGKRVKLPNIKVPLGEFVRFEPKWHGRLQSYLKGEQKNIVECFLHQGIFFYLFIFGMHIY